MPTLKEYMKDGIEGVLKDGIEGVQMESSPTSLAGAPKCRIPHFGKKMCPGIQDVKPQADGKRSCACRPAGVKTVHA